MALSRGNQLDLRGLNPPQLEAVLYDGGPLLVLAGAGSGKTRVITFRIARLLRDGLGAKRILGVTFTNKAAREMRERLRHLAGRGSSEVRLSTFHSLGLTILKEETEAAGLKPGFAIYDTSDQLSLVRELMRQVKVADRRLDPGRILQIILETKRNRRKDVQLDWGDDYELAAYDLYPRYIEQMRAFNAIDFDDLLLLAQDVLQVPEIRERWSQRFDQILVDEYQDTSPDQLELVRVLSGTHRNVCVVGDDDQSIYSWRGAVADNILAFSKHFPGAHEVVLDQNYRSTGNILWIANEVIRLNAVRKVKNLWSAGGYGEPVEMVACRDGEDEAAFVAEEIHKLLYSGARPEQIAVLYRSNAQSRIFEETLGLERIPYRVVGGQAFFERKEVRDAVAFIATCFNPYDEIALRRIVNVPPRGIGPTSLERLARWGEEKGVGLWGALRQADEVPDLPGPARVGAKNLIDTLLIASERLRYAEPGQAAPAARELFEELRLRDAILDADDATGIKERRLDNLEEVVATLERVEQKMERGSPVEEFLRNSALEPNQNDDDEQNKVTLMTLHSAKGLEFEYVFFVGCEEDFLPHKKTVDMGGALDEERRLCYVGVTRARRRLWLTYAQSRRKHGQLVPRGPSRFLEHIPHGEHLMRRSRDAAPEVDNDALAEDFFKKMRAQLEID